MRRCCVLCARTALERAHSPAAGSWQMRGYRATGFFPRRQSRHDQARGVACRRRRAPHKIAPALPDNRNRQRSPPRPRSCSTRCAPRVLRFAHVRARGTSYRRAAVLVLAALLLPLSLSTANKNEEEARPAAGSSSEDDQVDRRELRSSAKKTKLRLLLLLQLPCAQPRWYSRNKKGGGASRSSARNSPVSEYNTPRDSQYEYTSGRRSREFMPLASGRSTEK